MDEEPKVSDAFPAELRRRIETTVSCADSENLPRHSSAGEIIAGAEGSVQVMHNGVLVRAYGYYGKWMAEIISRLGGVHEPQEEKVFASVLKRLSEVESPQNPIMVELGSYWAYYSLWFMQVFPKSKTIMLEPDPAYLEMGKENFRLNGEIGEFVQGLISSSGDPKNPLPYITESSQEKVMVPVFTLENLLKSHNAPHADVVLADIQGAETHLLESSRKLLTSGAVRFLVVSTHDMSISGDPMTHQNALRLVEECGGHVVCEHSVTESFSGDGLIVASFNDADRDFRVEVSRARAKDSLFGEWEPRIKALQKEQADKLEMVSSYRGPLFSICIKLLDRLTFFSKNLRNWAGRD